jgi:hypothetical protein
MKQKNTTIDAGIGKFGQVILKHGVFPREKLVDFLNVNPDREKQVMDYCKKYSFVPIGDLTNGWTKAFEHIQKPIKELVVKIQTNSLTSQDLALLNSQLSGIKTQLKPVPIGELYLRNHLMPYKYKSFDKDSAEENTNPIPEAFNPLEYKVQRELDLSQKLDLKQLHIEATIKHTSSLTSLYEEVALFLLSKRKIKNCEFCGRYLLITRKSRKFCNDYCRWNSYDKNPDKKSSKNSHG